MAADEHDIQHWLDLIRVTKERLGRLELQKAQFGYATPPHIENEIAQARKDIELYTAQIYSGAPPSEKAKNAVPGDPEMLLLQYRVQQVEQQLRDGLTIIRAQIGENTDNTLAWRNKEETIRAQRQEEYDERMSQVENSVQALAERMTVFVDAWHYWFTRIVVGALVLVAVILLAAHYGWLQ